MDALCRKLSFWLVGGSVLPLAVLLTTGGLQCGDAACPTALREMWRRQNRRIVWGEAGQWLPSNSEVAVDGSVDGRWRINTDWLTHFHAAKSFSEFLGRRQIQLATKQKTGEGNKTLNWIPWSAARTMTGWEDLSTRRANSRLGRDSVAWKWASD